MGLLMSDENSLMLHRATGRGSIKKYILPFRVSPSLNNFFLFQYDKKV
jgi:hypothetical protein